MIVNQTILLFTSLIKILEGCYITAVYLRDFGKRRDLRGDIFSLSNGIT